MPRIRKSAQAAVTESNTWKIGIYIRLSREDKAKNEEHINQYADRQKAPRNVNLDSSGSIIEQDKIMTEWVEEYFREEKFTVVDYFVDDGLTGTDDIRDDFRRLIEYIEDGRINCFVVKTLSRAFRNYADQGRYLEQIFPRLGVRFVSASNPFVDSYSNPEAFCSGMEIPINGLMNDRYAAKTSVDIRRVFDAKRRRGEFIGAFAPYGYIKDPADKNSIIIDEEAAQHVRDIFHWFVMEGMSKRGIAVKLNELGVPNPTAYKQRVLKMKYQNPGAKQNDGLWTGNNVLNILKNEVYIGNMVQGRNRVISYKVHTQIRVPEDEWFVVPNTHEAIIDAELFHRVQQLHERDTRTAPGKRRTYLFSGLLRCADCQKAMRRKISKNYVYYHCRTVTDKGAGACVSRSIREDKLCKAVYDAIHMQIELVQSLREALAVIQGHPTVKTQSNRMNNMLKLRQMELLKITLAKDSLYLDWKGGDISKEDYWRMKAAFDEKSCALHSNIEHIQSEIDALEKGENEYNPDLTAFLKLGNIQELSRGMLLELIDMIYVHADGQVTIDFTFADEFKRVVDGIENDSNDYATVSSKTV